MGDAATAASGLVGGSAEAVGQYTWSLVTDRWWWSEGMYRIHGFAPGEVVPTTELLLAHKHPDDVGDACRALDSLSHGSPFSCYHRIIDAHRRVRSVVVVGDAITDRAGTVVGLGGVVVDLTAARRRDHDADVQEAVEGATRHRAAIEQAKGMLMVIYGIDAATASELLLWRAEETNVDLRLLAEQLVADFRTMSYQDTPQSRASYDNLLLTAHQRM
jgi:hypothetical protein